jgi:hypothetical protein
MSQGPGEPPVMAPLPDSSISLTSNDGNVIASVDGNIDVYGLASNAGLNTFPIYGYKSSAGVMGLENRTSLSPYVVDPSVTEGMKGTFTTLTAAITQAISDGATGDGVCIFIRAVTLNEIITVSTDSVNITVFGCSGKNEQNQNSGPTLEGTFTNSGNGNINFWGVDIAGTLENSGNGGITVNNAVISGTLQNDGEGGIGCVQCYGNVPTININAGHFGMTFCGVSGGSINMATDSQVAVYYTTYSGSLTGAGVIGFLNSYLPLYSNTMSSGTLMVSNCTYGGFDFYANTNVSYQIFNCGQGNVLDAISVAGDYDMHAVVNQHQYVGITDTSVARTVTLPGTSATVIKNQTFTIKDESGVAGTNAINVVVEGGTKTIDGLTSYPINTNYGAITVRYDGSNYFVY